MSNGGRLMILISIINLVVAILGLLFTTLIPLPSITLNEWMQSVQVFRFISIASFFLFLIGTIWFTFTFRANVERRWVNWLILYLVSCLLCVWVGTWIIPQSTVIIDRMDALSLWSSSQNETGTPPTISREQGRTTNAMKLSYTLSEDSWVIVTKEINPQILAGTKGIRFYYKGDGAPNTIELKLICTPDSNEKSAVYSVLWNDATNARDWMSLEASYVSFVCCTGTGCQPGEALKPENVWKIEIAVSNKPFDTPGEGFILIDDIQAFK